MSLYSIVQYVNDEMKYYSEDSQLTFATTSTKLSVATEVSEVLVSYKETPSDKEMVRDLKDELIRRVDMLQQTLEALGNY